MIICCIGTFNLYYRNKYIGKLIGTVRDLEHVILKIRTCTRRPVFPMRKDFVTIRCMRMYTIIVYIGTQRYNCVHWYTKNGHKSLSHGKNWPSGASPYLEYHMLKIQHCSCQLSTVFVFVIQIEFCHATTVAQLIVPDRLKTWIE